MFFSEYFFVNEGPAQAIIGIFQSTSTAGLVSYIELSLYYALFAVWLLIPLYYFKIGNFWALYIAAGFFGIATEGVVIPLIFTESLSWPALSWHVIADVLLGWYLMRRILIKNSMLFTIMASISLGLFWAFWASWSHISDLPFILSPGQFTVYALITSAGLITGYVLLNFLRKTEFTPQKTEVVFFSVLTLALWLLMLSEQGIQLLVMNPRNSILLVIYLGIAIYTLYSYRNIAQEEKILYLFRTGIAWWNMLILLLMPLSASGAYYFVYHYQIYPPTGLIVTLLHSSSHIFLGISLFMVWRQIVQARHNI
ncbi:putative membrane protein [Salinispira pacifica]|uniref:Putative membrane protein n=2 Tax=Salinispira pacifica TaxID=1307761 RepID=V5WIJ8_9SPIO|nr:putative membrane protein [Salinispira pacifica]